MSALRCLFRLAPSALLPFSIVACAPALSYAGRPQTFHLEILVDGRPLPQYDFERARYIEALKGKEFEIRLHNPLGVRVAVALSVDGLNTIDARHTTAREARKWVLGPYETVTISGWQTSTTHARRFFFTSEERAYASRLGQLQDMGIISAVFFRERTARVSPLGLGPAGEPGRQNEADGRLKDGASPAAAPAPAGAETSALARRPADEYAATGIGDRMAHPVETVHFDLEERAAAAIDVRYEFRAQLVRLGVLPEPHADDPLARRQKARGFEGGFCPDLR